MPEDKENPQNEGQGSRTAARACNEKTNNVEVEFQSPDGD